MRPTRRRSFAGSWISFCAFRKIVPTTPERRDSLSRIAPGQLLTLQVAQNRPAAILGYRRAVLDAVGRQPRPLVVHFEEQEIRNLRYIGLIRHALIPQNVSVIPDLLDEREFIHAVLREKRVRYR